MDTLQQPLPPIAPSQLNLPPAAASPATRLLEKRRQQFQADEALAAAKQQYATQARLLGAGEMQGGSLPDVSGSATHPLSTQPHAHPPQEAVFRQREEALKRRDLELQESLLRFTRFLQDNDAKRAKANRRAADEARVRGEREAEIARLHAEAAACRAQREGMQAALQKVAK